MTGSVGPVAGADKSGSMCWPMSAAPMRDLPYSRVPRSAASNTWRSPIIRIHRCTGDVYVASKGSRRAPSRALWRGRNGEGGRCALTNNPWIVDAHELRARFGFADVHIVNDFEAIAWSLPHFTRKIFKNSADSKRKLNAQCWRLVRAPVSAWPPIAAEKGGFVLRLKAAMHDAERFGARGRHHRKVEAAIWACVGGASVIRARSGKSLPRNCVARFLSVPERSAAEITQAGLAGHCAASSRHDRHILRDAR